MDDDLRYYLDSGVLEDDEDVTECGHCGWSIMPWQLNCEACGR